MALVKVGEKALIAVKETEKPDLKIRPKKKVLEEDAYTEEVEKIVERDFFPDLLTLKAKAEYLQALESNDKQKLREIHIKYGPRRGSTKTPSIYDTPATFETPEHNPHQGQEDAPGEASGSGSSKQDDKPASNPEPPVKEKEAGLDKFLAKNTSEDNESFNEIMEETERKKAMKNAWLYDQVQVHKQEHDLTLALPGIERQAIEDKESQTLQNWKYTIRNALMYIPDGTDENVKEKVENKKKQRAIIHNNTRFLTNPFNMSKSQLSIAQAAANQAMALQGKVGADGKEIVTAESPHVNGYGFMATPSPAPGVDESPMMTWGEIDGTPFRLDGSDTPRALHSTPGPTFKIPDVPKRDQIALDLAEKAGKSHRAKKEAALKHVTSRLSTPSPKFGSSRSTDRLQRMSPAAQRLMSSKICVRTNSDKALRASYTPSPSPSPSPTRRRGNKTPLLLTPKNKTPSNRTPGSGSSLTPSTTPIRETNSTPKRITDSLLTDNLLNLPKRKKAEDFF